MRAKWAGAALAAGMVFLSGWGLAGAVTLGCEAHPRGGCGVPDGGGKYFAAIMMSPLPLGLMVKAGFYRTDWRPALGFSAGAVAGAVTTLTMGASAAHWFVVVVLVLAAAVTPWLARRSTDAARQARHQEHKRRLRDERRARARERRRQRRDQ
ncbi:hypothetical protein AB0D57_26875 [Streptomyces sp. NPDC048275]|uniref:hypothetical protein n=1 Tax=Streptomyces sp. NPDC048275 TaxID=3155629 RepID=UPI0033F6C5FC